MQEYFKNIAEKNSCQFSGVCTIHPSVNALYQVILALLRETSFYVVKLKEFSFFSDFSLNLIIEGLSIFLINTSFNQTRYLNFIKELYNLKKEVKEKYISYCNNNNLPCEIINTGFEIDENTTISMLINYAQTNIINKANNYDKTKQRLFELITIFARLCAISIVKIKKIEPEYNEHDFEIVRFYALTNAYSIRQEKIKRRILEFCSCANQINEKLNSIYEKKYGVKEDASINLSILKGKSILVSGDDLDELEHLLNTLENLPSHEDINVYTNGPLIMAHFYPYFKNNKFLRGHYGADSAEYDFSVFEGVILITQNFIQKIDSLYKGEIFSNKLISFSKVFDIKENNFLPVIKTALKTAGYQKSTIKKPLDIKYDKKQILNYIQDFKEKSIVIVIGGLEGNECLLEHNGVKILNINYPLEEDILVEVLKKLKSKGVEIKIFFSQCTLLGLNYLLSLLNSDIDISLADCSHALINPHVIEALRDDFNVTII